MTQTQFTSIPIVLIIVCVIMGLNIISGALRGFVRKISGILSFILAGILVTVLLPYVTAWLHTTPVYTFIQGQCETIGTNLVQNAMSGALGSHGQDVSGFSSGGGDVSAVVDAVRSDDGSGALDRNKVKAQLQAMGYDPSIIDSMSDAELEGYAQQLIGSTAGMISAPGFAAEGLNDVMLLEIGASKYSVLLEEAAPSYTDAAASGDGEDRSNLLSDLTAGMSRVDQMKFIESLPLPQFLKDQMEAYNNENGYLKLKAKDFGSYVINYIASLIMNIIAYAVTLLAVWVIIRLILGALSVSRALPIFGTADHLLGMVLGVIQGLFIVWGLFMVLSLFAATQIGAALMQEINRTPLLSFLYNTNPLLNSAAGAIKGIM